MTNSSNKLAQFGARSSGARRASDESHPILGLKRTLQRYVLRQPNSHSSPFMLAKKSSYASPEEQLGLAAALGTLDGGRAAGAALGVR